MGDKFLIKIPADCFLKGTISVQKLKEFSKKIEQVSSCVGIYMCQIYEVDTVHYALIEASHECLKDLLEGKIISDDDIMTDSEYLEATDKKIIHLDDDDGDGCIIS